VPLAFSGKMSYLNESKKRKKLNYCCVCVCVCVCVPYYLFTNPGSMTLNPCLVDLKAAVKQETPWAELNRIKFIVN
jgi:hypothetical protein